MKLIGINNKSIKCACGNRSFYREPNSGIFRCYDCREKNEKDFIRMDSKSYFIFLGSADDSHYLEPDDVVGWTSQSEAEPDDMVFFYITAPVSAIVASGHIRSNWLNEIVNSRYEGRLMSDILVNNNSLEIPIGKLRELFPEWNWLRYPRQNTQIPHDIAKPFLELVNV